jgi:hypothetical protein
MRNGRRRGGRRLALLGVLAGVGLLVAAGIGFVDGRTTNAPRLTDFAPPTLAARGSATPAPSVRPTTPVPTSPPVQLSLPTLGVAAAVQPVVTTHGVLGVPDDPAQVGWWTGSVHPGSPAGSVVIDGHVDSAVRGVGALFRLTELHPGDPVTVTSASGTQWNYAVYARQVYSKKGALPADLFATGGPARLVLITCGGPFDAAARSYRDNVVVLASAA